MQPLSSRIRSFLVIALASSILSTSGLMAKTVLATLEKAPGGWQTKASIELDAKGHSLLKMKESGWAAVCMNFGQYWSGNKNVTNIRDGKFSNLTIVFTLARGSQGQQGLRVSLGDIEKGKTKELRLADYLKGPFKPGQKQAVSIPLKDFTEGAENMESSEVWELLVVHPFGEKDIELTLHEVAFDR